MSEAAAADGKLRPKLDAKFAAGCVGAVASAPCAGAPAGICNVQPLTGWLSASAVLLC